MLNIDALEMGRVKHIHFVGIGGAGMSGIAEVMHNLGYTITGSDREKTMVTAHLESLGIKVACGHVEENIASSDVLVVSSAIDRNNAELHAATAKRIPIVRRAEMLAELMRFSKGIAVAGTHGKTTTTSLVDELLNEGGLDPTCVIGGVLNSNGSHAKLGKGRYFVAEADESDASFLHLMPVIAVVTTIDADHLDNYQGDLHELRHCFIEFIHRIPFYGLAVLCIDDKGVRSVVEKISRPMVTYGCHEEADYRARLIKQHKTCIWFSVSKKGQRDWLEVKLNFPGRHNMLNALAAITVAHELGVSEQVILTALSRYRGISRRFQLRGEVMLDGKRCLMIDDYAHHPTAIEEILAAVRQGWPGRRCVMIYQPHRYTRTRDLFEDFCRVLSQVEVLFLLDVYPAGEAPIMAADSRALCRSIRLRGQNEPLFVEAREDIFTLLPSMVQEDDVLLTLGAGDIGNLSREFYQKFSYTVC